MANGSTSIGSVASRAIGLAIVYVILGALWGNIVEVFSAPELGSFGIIAQIGLGIFIAMLPFVTFSSELKNLF